MKLYNSIGPNPRLVRMFAAEKDVSLALVDLDILGPAENRREPFLSLNPTGGTPVLLLDDGSALAETVAICEYLEETCPGPKLIGNTPQQRAFTRMWVRRAEQLVKDPMTAGFRGAEGLDLFRDRVPCLPHASADFKQITQQGLDWFEAQIGERPFIVGDMFTLADIVLFCFVEFGALVGQGLAPRHARLSAWHARIAARPSAAA
jgi:glutathione S-transferase